MAGPAHKHLHLQDPACEASAITKQETRRSTRTRTPSASLVRFTAGEISETQSDIEANIEAEHHAMQSSMAEAGTKRARTGSNGDDGRGGKKKKAASPKSKAAAHKPMTKAQIQQHVKKEQRFAPETKFLECPNVFIRSLCHTKVEDFQWSEYKDKPIFVAKEQDTVANVFRGLIAHNLQSVPVTSKDMEKYHAFIDLSDIVHYVVAHFGADVVGQDKSFWDLLKEEKTQFESKIVRDIQQHPYATRHRFHAVPNGFSMFTVFDAMAKISGLRRVAVVDSQNNLFNLITQSQLVDHLHKNLVFLGPKGRKVLADCVSLHKPVFVIKENDTALDAFRLMDSKGVNGVGIVEDNGRLKGNLSTRDLKAVSHDMRMFWRLRQTVKNFVLHLRHEFQKRHNRPQRLVFAKNTDTIESVIRKLAEHKIHRLYIVDSRRVPIGIVSLRDIIAEILREDKGSLDEVANEFRTNLTHEAGVEDLEGYDFEEADSEPFVPAPGLPPPAPFQVPAVAATATAPGMPAQLVYPPVPHTAAPVQVAPVQMPAQAKPPLQITDLTVPTSGRDIPITPHQQMPVAATLPTGVPHGQQPQAAVPAPVPMQST